MHTDFIGMMLKGLIGIAGIMTGVYLVYTYGGAVSTNAIPLFLMPIGGAMFLANEPTRKGLAACGLSGVAVILVAQSSAIGWLLLLTIPPVIGYIVGTRSFKEWEAREVNDEQGS